MARGGLGWGPLDVAIAPSRTHKEAIAPVADWGNFFFVTGDRHVTADTLNALFLPDVAKPRQEDPTLTLPLPRGGDRRCS
ncbi:hypothetical protein NG791_00870 [Laspinema sp. D1]|uniref:hypothetical protein n=1 Tax=Laspinema palackyanum TaxID=3231601 RepID=UPI0034986835|nr:hypothetical protein [Laspinema sp. D2b]